MPQTEFCFENEWLYIHFYPYKNPYIHFFQYFEEMAFPQNLEKKSLEKYLFKFSGNEKNMIGCYIQQLNDTIIE